MPAHRHGVHRVQLPVVVEAAGVARVVGAAWLVIGLLVPVGQRGRRDVLGS